MICQDIPEAFFFDRHSARDDCLHQFFEHGFITGMLFKSQYFLRFVFNNIKGVIHQDDVGNKKIMCGLKWVDRINDSVK